MSYNMIDFNYFEKIDCRVESHFNKTFATYQKYRIKDILVDSDFEVDVYLEHSDELKDYAEIVVEKKCTIKFKELYGSDPFEKLYKGIDVAVGAYYVVDIEDDDIIMTAKHRGKVPSISIPSLYLVCRNCAMTLEAERWGEDTHVFVPKDKKKNIHLVKTTFGETYKTPEIGDRVIIIDSVENRDRTFTREVVLVEEHAKCTCDIITLDLPIDRIHANTKRIDGIGLKRWVNDSNNYTARLDQTQIWKRKNNFEKLLSHNANQTGSCYIQINNFLNMKDICKSILKKLDFKEFDYFGQTYHWSKFSELKPMHDLFGDVLCDEVFFLTSDKNRPDYLVHIDYHETEKDTPVVASFTWPMLNCDSTSTTIWYDCYNNGKQIFEYGKQDVTIVDSMDLIEKDRYHLSSDEFNSIILKQDDWHTVYNNSNTLDTRILFQWRFKPGISWDQIKTLWRERSTS